MYTTRIKKKTDFNYWFKRVGNSSKWEVLDEDTIVCTLDESLKDMSECFGYDMDADTIGLIVEEFEEFKNSRPEYSIGTKVPAPLLDLTNLTVEKMDEMQDYYEKLIRGIYYLTVEDESKAEKAAVRCIDWLRTTDFFKAPASTIYHDSCPCGLIKHSLKVVNTALDLMQTETFKSVDTLSAVLTAMVHDWCKIDFYESYLKNVKDENTGEWSKVLAYKYGGSKLPFGHGITSMFIAQKFFKLTTEQALAIRWHMGEYHVCDAEKHDLMDANEKYPLVLLLQTADRLSIL